MSAHLTLPMCFFAYRPSVFSADRLGKDLPALRRLQHPGALATVELQREVAADVGALLGRRRRARRGLRFLREDPTLRTQGR